MRQWQWHFRKANTDALLRYSQLGLMAWTKGAPASHHVYVWLFPSFTCPNLSLGTFVLPRAALNNIVYFTCACLGIQSHLIVDNVPLAEGDDSRKSKVLHMSHSSNSISLTRLHFQNENSSADSSYCIFSRQQSPVAVRETTSPTSSFTEPQQKEASCTSVASHTHTNTHTVVVVIVLFPSTLPLLDTVSG